METRLLNTERLDRMIDARDVSEAAKVLAECGYGVLSEVTACAVEELLAGAQADLFQDLGGAVKDRRLLDVFRCKYDYHNAKVLVKAEALGTEEDRLLLGGGRYDRGTLAENYRREDLRGCSEVLRRGIARAREVLGATGDPQQADFVLDHAYFEELTLLAGESGSRFLQDYVALQIDVANLRAAVRASRLGKGPEFLSQVLVPGGTVDVQTLAYARGEELGRLFQTRLLTGAAEEGAARSAPGSGPLTDFERLCDNAVLEFASAGRRVAFGEQPVIGYLCDRYAETTAIRTVMSGRMAGLDGNTIRQRLRRTYG